MTPDRVAHCRNEVQAQKQGGQFDHPASSCLRHGKNRTALVPTKVDHLKLTLLHTSFESHLVAVIQRQFAFHSGLIMSRHGADITIFTRGLWSDCNDMAVLTNYVSIR